MVEAADYAVTGEALTGASAPRLNIPRDGKGGGRAAISLAVREGLWLMSFPRPWAVVLSLAGRH